jgi:AraC-like DNA-binding protein
MASNYRLASALKMDQVIIRIHEMTSNPDDYFSYLPPPPESRRWGLGVTAAGRTRIAAGSPYPPANHPEDYQLNWEHGRVLDALQIVLISSGQGCLETRATGRCRVESGMVFLLLPGVWHRYRPDPAAGWTESWAEVRGPVVDEILLAGTFPPGAILRAGAIDCGVDDALDTIHRRIRRDGHGFEPELAADALRLIALCVRSGQGQTRPSPVQQAVRGAERYLTDHHAEPVNVEALAARLGVAYSHFRRAFREQTGFSPWKYVMHLRLTRAARMLASGDAKLDDIAARVGFSSGFHLSKAFKLAYGESPDQWRRKRMKGE